MQPPPLQETARRLRREIILMLDKAGSGHPGGSLSAADIITTLYFETMNIDPARPRMEERDRFVLCKGHAAPALYAALAMRGYFPLEDLSNLRRLASPLQGHPDMMRLPGVDMSTGSLGQGLSAACGIALSGKLNQKDYYTYALLGDGELQEGQVWEAAMFASHYKLGNLIAFVDHNGLQIDGLITEVLSPEPIDAKWRSFGWGVQTIDGHDFEAIQEAIAKAKQGKDQPQMI
ncbi:MAG: transketolase, partial [Clostridiales bacterium]|nr:transketolase [Clostridiales bacterium]